MDLFEDVVPIMGDFLVYNLSYVLNSSRMWGEPLEGSSQSQVISTFHVKCGSCCDSKRCFVPRWLQWRPSRFELSTRMAGDSSMYIRIAKASKKLQLGLCLRHQNWVTILRRQRVCKADVRRQGFTSKMGMLQFFACEHSMILTAVFSNFKTAAITWNYCRSILAQWDNTDIIPFLHRLNEVDISQRRDETHGDASAEYAIRGLLSQVLK